jgi:DNA-binding response OmpR family regulator
MNNSRNRILVVDDDPDIGMMIKTMLEYHGFSVVVTENAEETEDLVKTGKFDLLVMDMLLSGMNGTEICASLKSYSPIPIIMISAHPNADTLCLAAGASDFLPKPFEMQEMISKIRQYAEPAA